MKKYHNLKTKIIFCVMSVSVLLVALVTVIMSVFSVRATNALLLDNLQVTARIASQSLSSNLHLLTERMLNLSEEDVFTSPQTVGARSGQLSRLEDAKKQIEFVWLAAYDLSGGKLYGDEIAPGSIADTDYYSYLTQTGNIVIGEPHYDNSQLQLCVGAPVKQDGAVTGYLIGSYKYDLLNDVLSMLILGNTGSACILNQDGLVIGDRDLQNVIDKKDIYTLYPTEKNSQVFDKILNNETGSALMDFNRANYYVGYAPIPGTNWSLMINAPQREFMGTVVFSICVSVLLAVLLLGLAAGVIIPLSHKISASLSSATRRLQALADGNLTEEVALSGSRDETAILTDALAKTVESLNNYIQSIEISLGSLASGDYTIEIPDNFRGEFASIRDSLCHITDALNQTMAQMNDSSSQVNKNSSDVSDFARQLRDGSLSQAALLGQLEDSMAHITRSIEENRQNALQIEECSKSAEEKTAMGGDYMQSMLKTMEQIHSAVREISQISQLIKSISSQTNLVSLNASIEASRAGEAGKGFAVVASEVGALSKQITEALTQTGAIIEHSTNAIQKGLETAAQTATAFQEIQNVTDQYRDISLKLSGTVSQQTTAVSCVNEQLEELKQIAEANRSLAEETNRMASDSLAQSESLRDYVSRVKIKNSSNEEVQ